MLELIRELVAPRNPQAAITAAQNAMRQSLRYTKEKSGTPSKYCNSLLTKIVTLS